MIKFGLKIKTRGGMIVDSLLIAARDRADLERKVNQMYHRCEILECHEVQPAMRDENISFENAISLINKLPDSDLTPKN